MYYPLCSFSLVAGMVPVINLFTLKNNYEFSHITGSAQKKKVVGVPKY